MAKQSKGAIEKSKAEAPQARSIAMIASGDVHDSQGFIKLMSALMSDALRGAVDPREGNLVCNAGGKMLKMLELQLKHGPKGGSLTMLPRS